MVASQFDLITYCATKPTVFKSPEDMELYFKLCSGYSSSTVKSIVTSAHPGFSTTFASIITTTNHILTNGSGPSDSRWVRRR